MSSVSLIASIIVLLALLVCYAFISQTLVQRREKRQRVLNGLHVRLRDFKYILNSVPSGYLPKDLKLFVQRSLLNVLEQLTQLEPGVAAHKADMHAISEQMALTQRADEPAASQPLENAQQSKEIKACLEQLYKFVFHLENRGALSGAHADIYRNMIKRLLLELAVDAYQLFARAAQSQQKWRLAIHYYELGLKLLTKERKNGQFEARIALLNDLIAEADKQLAQSEDDLNAPTQPKPEDTAAWEKFAEGPDWKKKHVYD